MSLTYAESIEAPINPLDLVEELVGHNEWAFDRASTDELAVEIDGRWSGYRLFFLWQQDMGALHFLHRGLQSAERAAAGRRGALGADQREALAWSLRCPLG